MLYTLLWCLGAYVLIDLAVWTVRMNWEDKDRSGYCGCLGRADTLAKRWRRLCAMNGRLLANPCIATVADHTAALGCLLAWPLGRPYLRLPTDESFYDRADAWQESCDCILGPGSRCPRARP